MHVYAVIMHHFSRHHAFFFGVIPMAVNALHVIVTKKNLPVQLLLPYRFI